MSNSRAPASHIGLITATSKDHNATSAMKKRPLALSRTRPSCSDDPAYPDWVVGAINPDLEKDVTRDFNPARLELWCPPLNDRRQLRTGNWFYGQLKKSELLERCLGLRDLMEIKRNGVGFFRKNFGHRTVFGWQSVVRDRLGFLYAPYLFEFGDGVEVHWYLLEFAWERTTVWLFVRQTGKPGKKTTTISRS